jgi:Putative redox-active protein (C_GCAxxG_C_C)
VKRVGRRTFIKMVGAGAGVGALAQIGCVKHAASAPSEGVRGPRTLPWTYKPLDPDATGDRAFVSYGKGHCMYGSFESIVAQTAEQLGGAYRDFPFDMFVYGAGGVSGWATLCGALNGSAAAFQLLSPKPDPLIDALFSWYEKEALPNYVPKAAKFPNIPSVAGSPLCHQSLTLWCKAANKKTYSAERKERCGVITAAVARQAVMLLNAQATGRPIEAVGIAKPTAKCMSCHEKGGSLENSRGKMGCGGCHFTFSKHPEI